MALAAPDPRTRWAGVAVAPPEKRVVSSLASPFRVLDFGQVQVQIQVAALTTENFQAHLEAESSRLSALIRQRDSAIPRKAVVINDGSVELVPPASVRKLQAEWIKSHEDMLRLVCHRLGIIVPGALARHAMTAVLWLAPLPVPMKVLENMDEAVRWAIAEVDGIGGQVDAELRAGGRAAVERYLRVARDSTAALDEQLARRAQARAADAGPGRK